MSQAAHVRSIQTLRDLDSSLGRFAGEARDALSSADMEVRRALEWLQGRLQYWHREVERRQREVQAAQADLQRCLNSGYYDQDGHYHAPSCGAYEAKLAEARHRLQEAQRELRTVQDWMKKVDQAVQAYQRQAQRLGSLATNQTARAQALLRRKVRDLERYQAMRIPVMASVLPLIVSAIPLAYERIITNGRNRAVRQAQQQEMELVKATGRGTRKWSKSALPYLATGEFPKGYHGHHINSVISYPGLADNPDNITFLTTTEHKQLHQKYGYATSGRMYNRKSLAVQWARFK